jgi:acyl carrier protein
MADPAIASRIQRIFDEVLNISVPSPQTDIIEGALLDSLALVTLVFEVEQEFDLQIPLEALEIDDFQSIDSIADFVAGREVLQ